MAMSYRAIHARSPLHRSISNKNTYTHTHTHTHTHNTCQEPASKKLYYRHRFDAKLERFVEDTVEGEMETTTLKVALEGATRELYRIKIYTKWRGCDSYVAKKYRAHVGATRAMYFADCQMQMLAKNVAEEYNKLKPPHRVDFLECFVLEERMDSGESELWCCEKFVSGDYVKHSGNSGFVEVPHHRMTPHAFSHYSYLLSGGKRIIVDIQGVGDLWTDPQVHCIDKLRKYLLYWTTSTNTDV